MPLLDCGTIDRCELWIFLFAAMRQDARERVKLLITLIYVRKSKKTVNIHGDGHRLAATWRNTYTCTKKKREKREKRKPSHEHYHAKLCLFSSHSSRIPHYSFMIYKIEARLSPRPLLTPQLRRKPSHKSTHDLAQIIFKKPDSLPIVGCEKSSSHVPLRPRHMI